MKLLLLLLFSAVGVSAHVLHVRDAHEWELKNVDELVDVAEFMVLDETNHTSVREVMRVSRPSDPRMVVVVSGALGNRIPRHRRKLQTTCQMKEYTPSMDGLHSLGEHVDVVLGTYNSAHALANVTRQCLGAVPHILISVSDESRHARNLVKAMGVPHGWSTDIHRILWMNGSVVMCESSSRDATEAYEKCASRTHGKEWKNT